MRGAICIMDSLEPMGDRFRHKPTLGGITFSTLFSVSLIDADISKPFKADFELEMDLNVNSRGMDIINWHTLFLWNSLQLLLSPLQARSRWGERLSGIMR